jgi:hypothetical protein
MSYGLPRDLRVREEQDVLFSRRCRADGSGCSAVPQSRIVIQGRGSHSKDLTTLLSCTLC